MQKLRRLNLSDNDIQDIPDELGSLMSLEELDISKNGNTLHLLKKLSVKLTCNVCQHCYASFEES